MGRFSLPLQHMICDNCRYYKKAGSVRYCGLGYSCYDQMAVDECSKKEIKTEEDIEYKPILCDRYNYLPSNVEQLPKALIKFLDNSEYKLIRAERRVKQQGNLKHIDLSLIVDIEESIISKEYSSDEDSKVIAHIYNLREGAIRSYKIRQGTDSKRWLCRYTWTERISTSYLSKLKRRKRSSYKNGGFLLNKLG